MQFSGGHFLFLPCGHGSTPVKDSTEPFTAQNALLLSPENLSTSTEITVYVSKMVAMSLSVCRQQYPYFSIYNLILAVSDRTHIITVLCCLFAFANSILCFPDSCLPLQLFPIHVKIYLTQSISQHLSGYNCEKCKKSHNFKLRFWLETYGIVARMLQRPK